eukprot:1159849-Pelagomonas_calceolata.AAC.1
MQVSAANALLEPKGELVHAHKLKEGESDLGPIRAGSLKFRIACNKYLIPYHSIRGVRSLTATSSGTKLALKCSWRYKLPEHMLRFV